jgi:hypothetical protein
MDKTFGGNPVQLKEMAKALAGPYLDNVGALIPAIIKPIVEVSTNYNFFTDRPLTAEWISRSSPTQQQATFVTTETAKIMSRVLDGILSPIEVEHLMGGYTAGATTSVMRSVDEIAGLKDHPASTMPWQRFVSQQPHGQSRYVDELYRMRSDFEQREEELNPRERAQKGRVETAVKKISELRTANREGKISRAEAERRSYEIAKPLVESQR